MAVLDIVGGTADHNPQVRNHGLHVTYVLSTCVTRDGTNVTP